MFGLQLSSQLLLTLKPLASKLPTLTRLPSESFVAHSRPRAPGVEVYRLSACVLFPLYFIREQPRTCGIPPLRMSKKFLRLSPLATALRRGTVLRQVATYAHRFGDRRDEVHSETEP